METESKSRCMQLSDDVKLPTQLQDLLPLSYSYKLKKWTLIENKCNQFEAIILTNIYTEEEAQEWWHEFNAKSNTTMRVRATCPKTGKVNIFKIYLRCLHQGRAEKPDIQTPKTKNSSTFKRNTGCPAGMVIAIRRFVKYSRSKTRSPVDPIHPCEIQIKFIHNHPINSADSLRFRPVSREAEEKLLRLFLIGHSPSTALETLKFDLQTEHGQDYSKFASDRFFCPDKSFCFRLFYKNFGKEFANAALRELCNTLDSKILQYNADFGDTCISVKRSDSDYIIAVCTPLMKRAHTLQQSSSIIYVESSHSPGCKERTEHFVFQLIVHTAAGGVPLGVIVTTKITAQLLSLGFQLLKEMLPEQAFCGRGIAGPHAFFTEDSENLRIALSSTWPDALIVLCIFRMLQFMWRWLWDEKHNIHSDHRLYLLYLIKTVLYASSEIEMTTKYHALVSDNIIVHYPMFTQQVEVLWLKRHLWGICFYQLLPLDSASNYYEAAVRALKDRIFEQLKHFNLVQLMDFLLTRFDAFYRSKLHGILDGKVSHILRTHFSYDVPQEISEGIKEVAGNYFLVPSEIVDDKMYTVDPELNSCTCCMGITGAFCQHQYWIFLKIPNSMFIISFLDNDLKKKLHFVMTGSEISENEDQCSLSFPAHCNSVPVEEANLTVDNSFVKSCLQSISNSEISQMSVAAGSLGVTSNTIENDFQVLSEIENFKSSADLQLQSVADSTLPVTSSNLSSPLKIEDFSININDDKKNGLDKSRINDVADKFEQFCQRVKDGLKSQPKDFIPAVEIMMKNLERKGNTSNLLVAGLSFFGVFSDTTLKTKERKRPCAASKVIIPQVYGREMITYGKRKKASDSTDQNTALPEMLSTEELKTSSKPNSTSLQINSSIDVNSLQYLRTEMDNQMKSQGINSTESFTKLPSCVNSNPE